jgi:3-dehydroquinate dehydratase-2
MMKILIINGPNLNLLGLREPEIYGNRNYSSLCELIDESCRELGVEHEIFQSNHEGVIVDKIQEAYGNFDGIVINPAAYTHTSVAILDALKAVSIPTVEVHLSDVSSRDEFRKHSYISLAALKTVMGLGFEGYRIAIAELVSYLEKMTKK